MGESMDDYMTRVHEWRDGPHRFKKDERKEGQSDGNYFGEIYAQNPPKASSTVLVKCRGTNTATR